MGGLGVLWVIGIIAERAGLEGVRPRRPSLSLHSGIFPHTERLALALVCQCKPAATEHTQARAHPHLLGPDHTLPTSHPVCNRGAVGKRSTPNQHSPGTSTSCVSTAGGGSE